MHVRLADSQKSNRGSGIRQNSDDFVLAARRSSGEFRHEKAHAQLQRLPELDGYEVARRVRASEGGRKVRLIAVTGYGRSEDHQAILDAGFDEHLVKPVDSHNLARALNKPR